MRSNVAIRSHTFYTWLNTWENTQLEYIGDEFLNRLQQRQKQLREQKAQLSDRILGFMRDNQVDNFNLEGNGLGTISRSMRTSRPPLRREFIRTQLLLQFADQPQRVAEVLRTIEGVPEGAVTSDAFTIDGSSETFFFLSK